ncbi:uncharacterized protein BdWA1_003920, partial [Babesia duncani]
MTESDQHKDVYFQYIISGTSSTFRGCQIVYFTFNSEEYKFECNKEFMYNFQLQEAFVYACKIGSDFKPWLLQLVGTSESYSGYRNYFFKREDNVFKNHKFDSLTVPSGSGSFKHEEDNLAKTKLKTFTSVSGLSSASPAWYYKLTNSSGSSSGSSYGQSSGSFEIQPYNLASYLGDSDKKHIYVSESVSGSESVEHSVSSFSSDSGSESHTFEITFKYRKTKKSGGRSVTYAYDKNKSKLKLKGESYSDIVSGDGSSCNVTQAKQAVVSVGSNGSNGSNGPGGGSGSSGRSGSNEQPSGSQGS